MRATAHAAPLLIGATLLASCGGANRAPAACNGLPTTHHPKGGFIALGGPLTKRDLCATIGTPRSISTDSHGQQLWSYKPDGATFTLRGQRVTKLNGHAIIGG